MLILCTIREIVLQVIVLLQFRLLQTDYAKAEVGNFRNSCHHNHHLVVMIKIIVVGVVVLLGCLNWERRRDLSHMLVWHSRAMRRSRTLVIHCSQIVRNSR